jgi:membrane protein DedA with SNARE-associated domain
MDLVATARNFVETVTSGDTHGPKRSRRTKQGLLSLAGLRVGLALVALPLAPFLYRHDFLVLVLLRPSMAVLLAGAILAREGYISIGAMLGAAVPLQLVAVWLYFLLGDAWQEEIDSDDQLPFMAARLLQPKRVRRLRQTLRRHGPRLVILARFAIFPVGMLAAAAGASDMAPRKFFPADATGLLVAVGLVVGIGYGLGVSRREVGPWLLALGLAGLIAMSALLTWRIWQGPSGNGRKSK